MHKARRLFASLLATGTLAMVAVAPASAQQPPENVAGDSLVNIQIGDITVLAPIGVAANLCDVNANVLALQERTGGATCDATATSTATPGPGNGGGGNQAGNSLVNVQIGDVTILLPIAIAANICDVNVNILAQQFRTGGATCKADAESDA